MGEHIKKIISEKEKRAHFIQHLLDDIKALELMLEQDLIEDDIIRIGSEQEFCLVTENWRPSKISDEILEAVNDPHFTTELARYNLEINLDPVELKGDSFTQVENQLNTLLSKAIKEAKRRNNKVVLTGILPTISKNELELDYMTPSPRYYALNEMIKELKGSDFELYIRGLDELSLNHDSVLFEACNTSFQIHLQIKPKEFIPSYNWAQAISAPVLGVSTNSPLLLGRELWSETRIALFQQSIDTRNSGYALKDQPARVSFGNNWAAGSVADIYKNDLAQHKVILAKEIEKNALAELKNGNIPKLQALNLHNSTIYRWNRACYGIGGGKAHLRIENRYIPSGPSTIDEMANFAFWVGLMQGRPKEFDNMKAVMDFRDAKSNFIKVARTGKESVLLWLDKHISVRDLVTKELLPIAYAGLEKSNIDKHDIDRFLGIIENRAKGRTGSQWMTKNYRQFRKTLKQDDALLALTKSIFDHQHTGKPVHEWPLHKKNPKTHEAATQVGHIMSTQLFTVDQNDLAELATSIMGWKNIHHVPVVNMSGDLKGLLTWTHMKRFKARETSKDGSIVSDIMAKKIITVKPETDIKGAIALMKKNEIGCLPIVHDNHLVGIITITDVIEFDND